MQSTDANTTCSGWPQVQNRCAIPAVRHRRYTGPVPTLAQLRSSSCWVWVCCAEFGCYHAFAMGVRPAIIRWGADASSDLLRQRARCSSCGHLGASLRHPSWSGDVHGGDSLFPAERMRPSSVRSSQPLSTEHVAYRVPLLTFEPCIPTQADRPPLAPVGSRDQDGRFPSHCPPRCCRRSAHYPQRPRLDGPLSDHRGLCRPAALPVVRDRRRGRDRDEHGRAVFERLQNGPRVKPEAILFAFDLIELDGQDLRREPLLTRKKTLLSLIKGAPAGIRYNEHLEGEGDVSFAMPASSAARASYRSAPNRRLRLALTWPLVPVKPQGPFHLPRSAPAPLARRLRLLLPTAQEVTK